MMPGEMLCGPQSVFLMDSISTGLDSSTTFNITQTLKASKRLVYSNHLEKRREACARPYYSPTLPQPGSATAFVYRDARTT